MDMYQTYLAPGQRYLQPGNPSRRGSDHQVTIVRLDYDHFGFPRVTFRVADGREVTAYAVQIEAAIEDGALSPVVGAGMAVAC